MPCTNRYIYNKTNNNYKPSKNFGHLLFIHLTQKKLVQMRRSSHIYLLGVPDITLHYRLALVS